MHPRNIAIVVALALAVLVTVALLSPRPKGVELHLEQAVPAPTPGQQADAAHEGADPGDLPRSRQAGNETTAAEISIPGFEPFEAPVRFVDFSFRPMDHGPLGETYATLASKAAGGDAEAAYHLGRTLQYCLGAARTDIEFDDRVNALHQTRQAQRFGQSPLLIDDLSTWTEVERVKFDTCKGVTEQQIRNFYDWVARAADVGYYQAQVGSLQLLLDSAWLNDPAMSVEDSFDSFEGYAQAVAELNARNAAAVRRAVSHLQASRRRGSLQALVDTSTLYLAGILVPENSYSNLANAYAHLYAAALVNNEILPAGSYDYLVDARRLENRLSPFEVDAGRAMAWEILHSENCCVQW